MSLPCMLPPLGMTAVGMAEEDLLLPGIIQVPSILVRGPFGFRHGGAAGQTATDTAAFWVSAVCGDNLRSAHLNWGQGVRLAAIQGVQRGLGRGDPPSDPWVLYSTTDGQKPHCSPSGHPDGVMPSTGCS